jgi:hypothetical protein
LDRKIRKMLTIHGQQHPGADTDHLYVPRKDGGRGLMQMEGAYIAEIIKLEEFVEHTQDLLMQLLGHTRATQIQHCFKQLPTLRNLFRVIQSKRSHNSLEPEGKLGSRETVWTISM